MSTDSNRSDAQREASRANSAKSTGPRTDAGKARSSRNAMKHGIYSNRVILANENPEDYQQLLDAYIAEWRPVGQTEADLILQMVNARWRMDRVQNQARALENSYMYRQFDQFNDTFDPTDASLRQANALHEQIKSAQSALEFLLRSEKRFDALYNSARKQLIEQQKLRGATPKINPQPALALPGEPPTGNEPRIIGDHCTNPEEFAEFSTVEDPESTPHHIIATWVDPKDYHPSDRAA